MVQRCRTYINENGSMSHDLMSEEEFKRRHHPQQLDDHIYVTLDFIPVGEKPVPVDGQIVDMLSAELGYLSDVVILDDWVFDGDALHHDPNGDVPDPFSIVEASDITHWAEIPAIRSSNA